MTIKNILHKNSILFYTEGKNVTKGWINIKCPFCYDKSNHGGINPKKLYYNCWKCGSHPLYKVLSKLLNIEPIDAKRMLRECKEPSECKKIKRASTIKIPGTDLQPAHIAYLKKRGFDPEHIINKYKIKGTLFTAEPGLKYRIIIPIIYNCQIVSWQGRSISSKDDVKYIWCEKNKEIISHRELLYNLDNCDSESIIVTEGIFDVWKLGDNSCCTFGVEYSQKQLLLLTKYKRIFICFDPDEAGQNAAMKLSLNLSAIGKENEIIVLDTDPGNMSKNDDIFYLKNELGVY